VLGRMVSAQDEEGNRYACVCVWGCTMRLILHVGVILHVHSLSSKAGCVCGGAAYTPLCGRHQGGWTNQGDVKAGKWLYMRVIGMCVASMWQHSFQM
jgi:hypothetical protein